MGMTLSEVAALAKCSTSTVSRACQDGTIKGARELEPAGVGDPSWHIPDEAGLAWAKNWTPRGNRKRCEAPTATGPCDTILTRRWKTRSVYLPCPNADQHLTVGHCEHA